MESWNFATILSDIIKKIHIILKRLETKITIKLKIEIVSEFLFQSGKFKTIINFITKIKRDEMIEHIQLRDYEFEDICNLNETLNNSQISNKLLYSQILSNQKKFIYYGFHHENYENHYEEGNMIYPLLVEDLQTRQNKILDFSRNNILLNEGLQWEINHIENLLNRFTLIICIKFENANLEKLSHILKEVDGFIKINQSNRQLYSCILIFLSKSDEDDLNLCRGIDLNDFDENNNENKDYKIFKEKSKKEDFLNSIRNYEINRFNNLRHEDSELDYEKIINKIDSLLKIIPDNIEIYFCDARHYLNIKYCYFKHDNIYVISSESFLIKKFDFAYIKKSEIKSKLNNFFKFKTNRREDCINHLSKEDLEKIISRHLKMFKEMEFDTKAKFRNKNSGLNVNWKIGITINNEIDDFIIEQVHPLKISYEIESKYNFIINYLKNKNNFSNVKLSGSIYDNQSIEYKKFIKEFESLFYSKKEKINEDIKFTYVSEKQKLIDSENGLTSVNYLLIYMNDKFDCYRFRIDEIIENFENSNNYFSKIKFFPFHDEYIISPCRYKEVKIIEDEFKNFYLDKHFDNNPPLKLKIVKYKFLSGNNPSKYMKCIKYDYLLLNSDKMQKLNLLSNEIKDSVLEKIMFEKKLIENDNLVITINKSITSCKLCSGYLKDNYSYFYCKSCNLFYCEDCIYEKCKIYSDPHDLFYIIQGENDSKIETISLTINKLDFDMFDSTKKYKIVNLKNKNMFTYCNFCEEEINGEKFILLNEIERHQNLFSLFCVYCIFNRKIQSKILNEMNSVNVSAKCYKSAVFIRKI